MIISRCRGTKHAQFPALPEAPSGSHQGPRHPLLAQDCPRMWCGCIWETLPWFLLKCTSTKVQLGSGPWQCQRFPWSQHSFQCYGRKCLSFFYSFKTFVKALKQNWFWHPQWILMSAAVPGMELLWMLQPHSTSDRGIIQLCLTIALFPCKCLCLLEVHRVNILHDSE